MSISKDDPNRMEFLYTVLFERNDRSYRLLEYNTCWENERELEEMSIIFDGKDLQGNDLTSYKTIKWEDLSPGEYKAEIKVIFYRSKEDEPHHQLFHLLNCEKVKDGRKSKG